MTVCKSIKTSKKTLKRSKIVERATKNMRIDQFFIKNSSSDIKKSSSILEDNLVAIRLQNDQNALHEQDSDADANSCGREGFRKEISGSIIKKINYDK